MTKQKTFAILLTVALIISVLAGCGGGGGESGGGGASSSGSAGGGGSVAVGSNTATVVLPALPKEYTISQNVTAAAMQQYIYARLLLEQLMQTESPEEFEGLIDGVLEAFEYAGEFAEKAMKYADFAELVTGGEGAAQAEKASVTVTPKSKRAPGNPFVLTAYAAGEPSFDAKTWAEGITKTFDEGQPGQQVRNLAEQLGVDAKDAYEQLKAAQDIIKKGADADAAFFDTAMKAAMATKTACKVGMLVTGTIVTAGGVSALAAGSATLGEAAVFMVNAADCIVDIGVTTSTIIVGEDHKLTAQMNKLADTIAPVTAVVGLHGLYKTDFSQLGKLTQETAEVFDYIGQSLTGYIYDEKKAVGIDAKKQADVTTEVKATAVEIPVTDDGKVDTDKLNADLAQANLPALPGETPAPKPIAQTIAEFEKSKPDPATVSKQIDEALKQIEELLVELGKVEAAGDIAGTYSGMCHYARIDRDGDTDDEDIDFTIEISAIDSNSSNYEIRIFGIPAGDYYWIDSTFTGKFDGRHFQGSYNKVDGVDTTNATIIFSLSDAGDSLTGELVEEYLYHNPGSIFDDDWATITITLNMTKQ